MTTSPRLPPGTVTARAPSGADTAHHLRPRTASTKRSSRTGAQRNELILRLLAERCEICDNTMTLEVHHGRKLADLAKPGRRDKPEWMRLMATWRRKTLITCRHDHPRRPGNHAHQRSLESGVTGNYQAPFGSSCTGSRACRRSLRFLGWRTR